MKYLTSISSVMDHKINNMRLFNMLGYNTEILLDEYAAEPQYILDEATAESKI